MTGKSVLWMGADKYDLRHPWVESNAPAELYNLDAAPYESLMVGYFSIYQGNPRHKNFVQLGFCNCTILCGGSLGTIQIVQQYIWELHNSFWNCTVCSDHCTIMNTVLSDYHLSISEV